MNSPISKIPFLNKRIKFPVTPHIPGGMVTPNELRAIAAAAEKYDGVLKIVGNAITILNVNAADGEKLLSELGAKPQSFISKSVRPVSICPSKPYCPRAVQDSATLGLELDKKLFSLDVPAKIRIGVSGCPNCCAEVFVKDIGLFATAQGYTLILGGNAGRQAQVGKIVAEKLPPDEVLPVITKILAYYKQNGQDNERLSKFLNRVGWDSFITSVIPVTYQKMV